MPIGTCRHGKSAASGDISRCPELRCRGFGSACHNRRFARGAWRPPPRQQASTADRDETRDLAANILDPHQHIRPRRRSHGHRGADQGTRRRQPHRGSGRRRPDGRDQCLPTRPQSKCRARSSPARSAATASQSSCVSRATAIASASPTNSGWKRSNASRRPPRSTIDKASRAGLFDLPGMTSRLHDVVDPVAARRVRGTTRSSTPAAYRRRTAARPRADVGPQPLTAPSTTTATRAKRMAHPPETTHMPTPTR